MKLNPYPKYKKTDIAYFDKIPSHWDILPNRAVFQERNTKNTKNEALLSVTIKQGVIKQKELLENSSKKDSSNMDKSKYKLVLEGDLPYNKMRMWQGAVGVSKYRGIVSPAYIVLKPRKNIYSDYFHFLLRTPTYIKELHRYSYGICDDQLSLRFKDFKLIKSVLPPLEEQKNISAFIHAKENKIAKFIRNKRRLIKLLKELKQAIINQAVTRGIDSNVRLKPSGVEWFGDIPQDWKTKRLKLLFRNIADQTIYKNNDEIYIALEYVESWTGKLTFPKEKIQFESQVKKFVLKDILFCKLRPYLAKVVCADFNGVCVGEFLVLRNTTKEILPKFMEFKLRSSHMIDFINSSTFGAKMPRADWRFIGNILVSYPASSEEQKIIVCKIIRETKRLDQLIKKAEREINIICEYRTRLISDVVTGKLDVRNINVSDEEIIDDSSINEEMQDLNDNIKEVSSEH